MSDFLSIRLAAPRRANLLSIVVQMAQKLVRCSSKFRSVLGFQSGDGSAASRHVCARKPHTYYFYTIPYLVCQAKVSDIEINLTRVFGPTEQIKMEHQTDYDIEDVGKAASESIRLIWPVAV